MHSSTSTASLLLFPTSSMSKADYSQFQLTAQLPLPPPVPPPKDYPSQFPVFPQRPRVIRTSFDSPRPMSREEKKRKELTSWRSEDGLLSPPPLPRRKQKRRNSLGSKRPANLPLLRTSRSTPDLPLLVRSAPPTGLGFRLSDDDGRPLSHSPHSRPGSPGYLTPRTPSNSSYSAHSPLLAATANVLVQPPRPSLLRPNSFWKNHPRSALSSPLHNPSSYPVRRSTFIAAGLNLEQGGNGGGTALAVESRTMVRDGVRVVVVPGVM